MPSIAQVAVARLRRLPVLEDFPVAAVPRSPYPNDSELYNAIRCGAACPDEGFCSLASTPQGSDRLLSRDSRPDHCQDLPRRRSFQGHWVQTQKPDRV